MATPQFVHEPPEKPLVPVPLLVRGLPTFTAVPLSSQTWALFAEHTVSPVNGFEPQELITSPSVAIRVGTTLLPSMLITETPVAPPLQRPLGTYEVTFVPIT